DHEARVIGAAHAGWNGALKGICAATLDAMEAIGATRSNIAAAIGPAIQQDSYEVGPEFRDRFNAQSREHDRFFVPGQGDRYQFDLTGFVQAGLLSEGVGAVDNLGHDTCAMDEVYFSNRRRNHRGEPDYGRNASVIVLNG
ncbi:MAG: laccase domain-containing protein, partial [Pseudomonadota bacterium]